MIRPLFILLLIFVAQSVTAKEYLNTIYQVKLVRVLDGDTIEVEIPVWLDTKKTVEIRAFGIDTPEKSWRGKCDKEKRLGELATQFTKGWVKDKELTLTYISYDKFGGRFDGIINNGSGDLGDALIKAGHAREYFGKKKQGWCDAKATR